MVDKVQKPGNRECGIPSSEPFRIYLVLHLFCIQLNELEEVKGVPV